MWSRKELKQKAKKVVKRNYWSFVIVCFILAIVTGEFNIFSINIGNNDESVDYSNIPYVQEIKKHAENYIDEINIDLKTIDNENVEVNFFTQMANHYEAILNNLIKSYKCVYKVIDATRLLSYNLTIEGIILFLSAGLALLFLIFIAEPLKVGGKRFFIKSRKRKNQKLSVLASVFSKDEWSNITKIMLLKNVFLFFWMFTIVGWFIKRYEYEMVQYILAENPHIHEKEAFKQSKEMMQGNKWKTFVLDISFILWDILSVLTLGFVAILYVNEYKYATKTELYAKLKGGNYGRQTSDRGITSESKHN